MTPPRAKRPKPRAEDLVRISTELFSEHGYEGTSVRMIAERMGVFSGSLYSHVSSKDELLTRIVMEVAELFLDRVRVASETEGTHEERLRAMARAHLSVLGDRQQAVTVYYNEWRWLDESHRKEIVALRDEYERMFTRVIDAGMRSGEFGNVDTRQARVVLLSACNWTYQWYSQEGSLPTDQIADGYTDVVIKGLRSR